MQKKTLIIAEAGVNHNGSLEIAKRLIDAAKEAGVDYVKFQTFKAEKIVNKDAAKADYQIENTQNADESQFQMIKKLELDREKHDVLIDYCNQVGIKFFSTAFDLDSVDLLEELGIKLFKIPSGEITNLPYLEKIASKGTPIILSTGMSDMDDIENALKVLTDNGATLDRITVLHCNTEYPTPMQDVNLRAMNSIAEKFGVAVGYSDHTLGIEVPTAAVALGAVCIEKHFTLDRNLEGPDHRASLEPGELKAMVTAIRNIEKALGNGVKAPSDSEKKNIAVARKSLHAAKNLQKGTVIGASDLEILRPGNGISPMRLPEIIGKTLNKDIAANKILSLDDFE